MLEFIEADDLRLARRKAMGHEAAVMELPNELPKILVHGVRWGLLCLVMSLSFIARTWMEGRCDEPSGRHGSEI